MRAKVMVPPSSDKPMTARLGSSSGAFGLLSGKAYAPTLKLSMSTSMSSDCQDNLFKSLLPRMVEGWPVINRDQATATWLARFEKSAYGILPVGLPDRFLFSQGIVVEELVRKPFDPSVLVVGVFVALGQARTIAIRRLFAEAKLTRDAARPHRLRPMLSTRQDLLQKTMRGIQSCCCLRFVSNASAPASRRPASTAIRGSNSGAAGGL